MSGGVDRRLVLAGAAELRRGNDSGVRRTSMIERRHVLTGLGALSGAACAGVQPRAVGWTLTVATFNIWHDQRDWRARAPLVIDALRQIDADVIGLQEVLEDAGKGLPNQAATLAEALGYRMIFVSTDPEGNPRRYGNAVLSRLPVVEHDWRKLEPLDDYRTALRVRVLSGGRPVDVVNTHLHHTPGGGAVRARQMADLLAWLESRTPAPLIVFGDFNAVQEEPGLVALGGSRFVSGLPRGAARTTLNPATGHTERVIDHIFAKADAFEAVSGRVFATDSRAGVWPSDHFGVVASFKHLQGD